MKPALYAICALFAILVPVTARGWTGGSIKGSLLDEASNKPIQFVNVVLRRTTDSSIVSGRISDASGKFAFLQVPSGEYILDFRLIGYKSRKTRAFVIDSAHENLNLGELALTEIGRAHV